MCEVMQGGIIYGDGLERGSWGYFVLFNFERGRGWNWERKEIRVRGKGWLGNWEALVTRSFQLRVDHGRRVTSLWNNVSIE